MATPAEEIDSAYRRALRLSRERSFRLTRAGVFRLYLALAEVINRLAAEESTGIITAERAEGLRREVDALLGGIRRALIRLTEEGVGATLIDVVEIHRQVTRELFRRYGPGGLDATRILAGFDRLPVRALAAMTSRPNAATFRTLINRRIAALAPEIDTFLDAAVARGVSVSRTRNDLARIMARDDPRLIPLLDRYEAGEFDFRARGLDEFDAKGIRGLLYDARRIVVSETNNAHRTATAAAMDESPVVIAAKWQLSGRHFREDICDVLATSDAHGYGPGFYPPDAWPDAGHPHCGCYQGRAKFRRPAEWARPKGPSRPLEIDPRDPIYTAEWASDWTEAERGRYQRQFAGLLRESGRRLQRAG